MAGKDVSYQFLDALAKSVGMGAETVKQALAEINQLQQQTQALEVAVQGKVPTNHASRQPIFGTADEQIYDHVKIAHEVTNDSTNGVAVSPDAVYAYAPDRATTPVIPNYGSPIVIAPTDTSVFSSYQATGDMRLYNGLVYTNSTIRVQVTSSTWLAPIINNKLSLSAIAQADGHLIDTVRFADGVPNWPQSGTHTVSYIIPAYSVMPGSVYKVE
jgi:hypothetical protein